MKATWSQWNDGKSPCETLPLGSPNALVCEIEDLSVRSHANHKVGILTHPVYILSSKVAKLSYKVSYSWLTQQIEVAVGPWHEIVISFGCRSLCFVLAENIISHLPHWIATTGYVFSSLTRCLYRYVETTI